MKLPKPLPISHGKFPTLALKLKVAKMRGVLPPSIAFEKQSPPSKKGNRR